MRRNRNYYLAFDDPIPKLAKDLPTPKKLARWIWWNLNYKTDRAAHRLKDYWQNPLETLHLGTGDCEDYSILGHAVLTELGYNPGIIGVYNAYQGHAECFFHDPRDNYWYIFSNMGLRKVSPLWVDIPRKVFRDWKVWRVYTPNGSVLEECVKVNGVERKLKHGGKNVEQIIKR